MNPPRILTIGVAGPVNLGSLASLVDGYTPETDGLGSPLITDLTRAIHARGHQVEIFTLAAESRDLGDFVGKGMTLHVRKYRDRGRWIDAFRSERHNLTSAMATSACDVIHAHWTYEFAMAALASDIPSLITVHDWGPEVLKHHRHPYRVARLGMQWQVLRAAPSLTANSPYIAEKIRRWYRREVPVVPNCIAVPDHLPPMNVDQGPVIGSVNNGFSRHKNVQILLEAFARLRDPRPNAALRLVGNDYQQGGPANGWAEARGLAGGVDFVGPIPAAEIPAFMRSIDVLVHPSLEESFGMTLVEAIIQGTPVIGGRRSGAVPWVLGEGEAGTLVDVTDPDAICQAVIHLPSEPTELGRRRQRALDHVRAHFSMDRVVDQYEEMYRDVLT